MTHGTKSGVLGHGYNTDDTPSRGEITLSYRATARPERVVRLRLNPRRGACRLHPTGGIEPNLTCDLSAKSHGHFFAFGIFHGHSRCDTDIVIAWHESNGIH